MREDRFPHMEWTNFCILMKKPKHPLSFPIRSPRADESLLAWLHRELRAAILDGRLKPGAVLPPTRALAAEYGIARGTVVRAFEQLLDEGYLESRTGSGTTVSRELPDQFFNAKTDNAPVSSARKLGSLSKRGADLAVSPFLKIQPIGGVRAFRANRPSVDHFPTDLWSRLSARRMRLASRDLLQAGDVMGYRPLREAIAAHLGSTRGVICDADQVMIVTGTQQALDMVARLTIDPGDSAWVEDPSYLGAEAILRANGAKILPVSVDEKGMRISEGIRKAPHARVAYVTPANQFPLCVSLPLERRLQLIEWSRTNGAWIFEDDYDSEFNFAGRPLAAMQGLDPAGNVFFSGSFSKMLYPSLRMGFLVIPPHMVDALRAARSLLDRYMSVLGQTVLCDFIAEGHFSRYLRKMRQVYAENLNILVEVSRQEWGDRLKIQEANTGLQTIGWLNSKLDDVSFAKAALASGVEVTPLSAFALRWKRKDGLQIGFASVGPKELRRGITALASVL